MSLDLTNVSLVIFYPQDNVRVLPIAFLDQESIFDGAPLKSDGVPVIVPYVQHEHLLWAVFYSQVGHLL